MSKEKIILNNEDLKAWHRMLWQELGDTGEKNKRDTKTILDFSSRTDINELQQQYIMYFACFICAMTDDDCRRCPVKWGEGNILCAHHPDSYYEKWVKAPTIDLRRHYAYVISNLI